MATNILEKSSAYTHRIKCCRGGKIPNVKFVFRATSLLFSGPRAKNLSSTGSISRSLFVFFFSLS